MDRRLSLAPTVLLLAPLLTGCIASTAANIVTAPVRVGAKGIDMMTTSQSEADQKRGRDLRHREERLGRLQRQYDRHSAQCMRGDEESCDQARLDYAEIQNLRETVRAR
jgi:hypothetical protein